MANSTNNIFPNADLLVPTRDKELFLNQKGITFWFTGLSGSGKSTIAIAVEKELFKLGYFTKVLDGDNIRKGICSDLNFTQEDRSENIRRISEISKLMNDAGLICINTFVSPSIAMRSKAKEIIGADRFVEIFVNTSLAICEERDTKGLYKKARAGEIKDFTGVDSVYENPINPDLELNTSNLSIKETVTDCLKYIFTKINTTTR